MAFDEMTATAMREAARMEQEIARLHSLLREARAAIEPLTGAQIKLHRIRLDLGDRIDAAIGVTPSDGGQQ